MRKLRTALTAVATLSMVLATTGAAFAQGSSSWESRADFVFQLDKALGIQPVYPATPDFQDVSVSSPYYGYIEAAFQDGITNGIAPGIFGPSLGITRAEAAKYLVIAFGAGAAAANITSTSFSDNGDIPTALVGYVGEAAALGLMKGFPGGTFNPDGNLTVTQEGYLLNQLTTAMSALSLKVTASATDVAAGQLVTLSTSGKTSSGATVATPIVTYSLTGTNAADALLSGSTFVASAPGNYTVQASSGTATGTATIGVYGGAAGLKISAPTSVVANGASQTTVTVSVVDANGNVAGNNSDTVTLGSNATGAVSVVTSSEVAVNGVATFTIQSGNVPGAVATLMATDTTQSPHFVQTATVSTTQQTATAIAVAPSTQYLSSNQANNYAEVDVTVLDQSGEPMLYGTYPFSVALTGPATFAGGSTAATTYVYTGNGLSTNTGAPVDIYDVQGETGAVTVSATATGLTAGSATVTAVIAGSPAAIQLTAPTTTSFAQGLTGGTANTLTYTAQLVDSHGYPVPVPAGDTITATVLNSLGAAASNLTVTPSVNSTAGTDTFTISEPTTASADAGAYTIQVSDTAGLTPSSTDTFTETANSVALLSVSGATYVSAANPSETITAQLTDLAGNPVAEAGVPVTFSSTNTSVTLSSTTPVATNSSGVATVTAAVPSYVGSSYTVEGSAAIAAGVTATNTTSFTVDSTTATSVTAALLTTSGQYNGSQAIVTSGDTVTLTVYGLDQYGNPVQSGDTIGLSYSGTGSFTAEPASLNLIPGTNGGYQTVTLTADASGTVSVTATDASVAAGASSSATMAVVPGALTAFNLYDASGYLTTGGENITADTPLALTLKASDLNGNAAIANANYTVDVVGTGTGSYRVGSASNPSTKQVSVPAGSSGVAVYYVDSASYTASTALKTTGYAGWSDATNSTTIALTGTVTVYNDATSGVWSVAAGSTGSGNFSGNTFTPATAGTVILQYTSTGGTITFTFTVQ